MAKKILTYREVLMNEFKHPIDKEPIGNIKYVGRNGAIVMYSFDDEKVEIFENLPEHEQRVWDLDDPTEVSEMKEFIKGISEISLKLSEIELSFGGNASFYVLLKGIVNNDQKVIDMINAVDEAKDNWLKDLGLPGMSIIE